MIRTAQLDADNRRNVKDGVECYCCRCHKELKNGQPRRFVTIRDWSFAEVVHPESFAEYNATVSIAEQPGRFPVGMDCARRIGMEFTTAE